MYDIYSIPPGNQGVTASEYVCTPVQSAGFILESPSLPNFADMVRLSESVHSDDGYLAAIIEFTPRSWKEGEDKPKRNDFFRADRDRAAFARRLVFAGQRENAFFGTSNLAEAHTGALRPNGTRKHKRDGNNVHSRKSFHGELDVGKRTHYKTFDAAKTALLAAYKALSLPEPVVVCSGTGLHFYSPLTEPMTDMRLWRVIAVGLKAALESVGLVFVSGDACCFCDRVRILRPPGSQNHKPKNGAPKPVFVSSWGDGPASLDLFAQFQGMRSARSSSSSSRSYHSVKPPEVWELFYKLPVPDHVVARAGLPRASDGARIGILADAQLIASNCNQLRHFAETGCPGDGEEPVWRSNLSVLAFCAGGEAIAHELSALDVARYDRDATQAKFDGVAVLIAPHTCDQFRSHKNGFCDTCIHKIHSPIELDPGDRQLKGIRE